jgi:predicted oxidoreductase
VIEKQAVFGGTTARSGGGLWVPGNPLAARVLGRDGKPLDGLFAVGNDAASIFGGSYPGAGATLGRR